ncbi:hypothetical protein [Pyxidicoccus xibeiensis]|uniref:hypothetical protein n=1 Tax=Pyxidicoccus xibeiensis TaxID=2906759 RepID=UPI0020A71FE9|nr:hypothetical protein [Pyxidicoccus xibeiensis]MCP3136969.1 hypothetical protein [Pyxidicoccus xibeiensis]
MGLRKFPAGVETVANEWAQTAILERAWKHTAEAPLGESKPFYVRSGDLAGVAKPRETKPPPETWPRAAIEKICADLAYELDLPVPPAILWRASKKLDLPIKTLSVSLFPFDGPIVPWGAVEDDPASVEHLLPHFLEPGSALVAFDSWVGNTDRKNPGNLIFKEEEDPSLVRVAYIDFAGSLMFGLSAGADPSAVAPVLAYPDASQLDVHVLKTTIEAIERLPRSKIGEIVGRIPDEFLSASQKHGIQSGLVERQSTLRASLVKFFGELAWAGEPETCG